MHPSAVTGSNTAPKTALAPQQGASAGAPGPEWGSRPTLDLRLVCAEAAPRVGDMQGFEPVTLALRSDGTNIESRTCKISRHGDGQLLIRADSWSYRDEFGSLGSWATDRRPTFGKYLGNNLVLLAHVLPRCQCSTSRRPAPAQSGSRGGQEAALGRGGRGR